jgi:uncharacterized protein (DUF2252 family)
MRTATTRARNRAPSANGDRPTAAHPPAEERAAIGRAARARVSRRSQAEWAPPGDRESPLAILERQDATRLPELIPIKYGRMLESPFAFYRGSAAVMAADLGSMPSTGLRVQLCGDAHLANFGAFASPDRALVFDLNDFDETVPGPFEWDVKRLAASIEIAGRHRGFRKRERRAAVTAAVAQYRTAMQRFAQMGHLAIWYLRMDERTLMAAIQHQVPAETIDRLKRGAAKARSKDHLRALARLTETKSGSLRFASQPPLLVPVEELLPAADSRDVVREMNLLLADYRQTLSGAARRLIEHYRFTDMARKVVGVGSVGTRAWVLLLTGRDDQDPLFLQVKEAQASVLEPFAGSTRFSNRGRRVVEGQWLIQAASDIFLGWIRVNGIDDRGRDFYVRQLWDWKASADLETLDAEGLILYARMCGWTLAHAHARSGDPAAIAGYLGRRDVFDRAMVEFAVRYADQAERDFAELGSAVKAGQVEAQRGI